jgi:hypothetical protein
MLNNEMNTLFAEGGMNQQGGTKDPVSGNDVPPGALQSEVRDDISAKLSEGEFVIPADVVRYIGLERLMKIRDEAKAGLARMDEIGQMGNSDQVNNPEALHGDEFGQEIDDIISEVDKEGGGEGNFAVGGAVVVPPADKDLLAKYGINRTAITNSAIDVRVLKNDAGQTMYMTYFNGKPASAIPSGYKETTDAYTTATKTETKTDTKTDTKADTTSTGDSGGTGGGDGGGTTEGGASVGTSSGISGTSIGNSAIGIAVGAVANAIDGMLGVTNDAVSVSDTVASPSDAAASADADGIGSTEGSGNDGGNDGAGEGSSGTSGASAGDSGSGDSGGDGGGLAKGGLVTKRSKKSKK